MPQLPGAGAGAPATDVLPRQRGSPGDLDPRPAHHLVQHRPAAGLDGSGAGLGRATTRRPARGPAPAPLEASLELDSRGAVRLRGSGPEALASGNARIASVGGRTM